MQRQIFFYETGQNYDIFSNVTDIGFHINIDGIDYHPRSSEAVYQGLKASASNNLQDRNKAGAIINDQSVPGSHIQKQGNSIQNILFATGQVDFPEYNFNRHSFYAPQKIELKEQIMFEILLVKFTQNPEILKALLETDKSEIIENTANASYDDSFWGNGHKFNGRNALGIALMRVRDIFRYELEHNHEITVRNGLSIEVCSRLGIATSKSISQKSVTQQDLNAVSACTTVSEFHQTRLRFQMQPQSNKQSQQYNHGFYAPSQTQSTSSTSLDRLRKATGDDELIVHVYQDKIQLHFSNSIAANNFANNFEKVWRNSKDANHFSIGVKQEEYVFKKLNLPVHGKTNPHPFGDALKYDYQQSQPQTNVQPKQQFSHGFHAQSQTQPTDLTVLDRLRKATEDNGLTIQVDDQDKIQLHFSNSIAANNFANNFEQVWRNSKDANHFSIGVKQEEYVFTKLNLPVHGKTNPHPFGDALKYDYQNKQPPKKECNIQ